MIFKNISNDKKIIYALLIFIVIASTILLIRITIDQRSYDKAMYNQVYDEYEDILKLSEEYSSGTVNKERINRNSIPEKNVSAILSIEKINIFYPIISNTNYDNLKISPTKFYGCNANEVGNFCIVGHNNRDNEQFSKLDELTNGDSVRIISTNGYSLNYTVYDKYVVEANDLSCTSQKTDGQRIVTLITCTENGKRRLVVKCKA